MKSQKVKIGDVKINPNNPRIIKDVKFKKLVLSVKDFPEMLEIRPIVVNADMVVLGGNMRLKACKEAGIKEVPIIIADNLTEEQQREFLIKDNVSGGEWDWELLANEWDSEELDSWGLDVPVDKEDDLYTTKIESPIYTPKGEKPKTTELFSLGKYNELIDKINLSNLCDEKKLFLQLAATRHIEFDYSKVAEFYSHEDEEKNDMMEDSALVIIDYNKAIELGFVKIHNDIETLSDFNE